MAAQASSSTLPKTAIHFGAGNIGRGFIAPLLVQSGYDVVFLDVQQGVIDELNRVGGYNVHILDVDGTKLHEVRHVSGLHSKDERAPDVIANADIITTSVGPNILQHIAPTIAQGLLRRCENGRGDEPLTVIACENMIGATDHLKDHIIKSLSSHTDEPHSLLQSVGFPNCEVDRIVPPFRGDNLLDVGVESFYEWTVEKSKVRPANLSIHGMQLEDSLEPFLERKLFTLNCAHAILAYTGMVKGFKTIHQAIEDKQCRDIALGAIEQSGAALINRHGFDPAEHYEYIERIMKRFANPSVKDELSRVGRGPMRKLSPNERLVGAVRMCQELDLPRGHLLTGIAHAFFFDVREDEEAQALAKLVQTKGITAAVEETTKFQRGSQDHSGIVRAYSAIEARRPSFVRTMSML
ncbi:mannitol-1-phosphate 5-dehydrogenase [Cylindrobasidium torrendii FP15055 ss-10]|uniref:Mannitol-1-phosphate 5-dehydrogenase n=1 Tax=Cylindrobasidium torrendii FP15055 ss-10 TaxID=1314674 RepID=A0A0D7BEZ1_9AGAR|nr:mannitol-1-phosphate 5-dehydrogenase [Cylindrobasidium torrendii FP15055 ss-10]